MVSDFDILEHEDVKPQGRCERCKLVYGRPQKHNESALRCASCDYPFGETVDGIRSLALVLQEPVRGIYFNVYSQVVCYVWLRLVRDGLDLSLEPCLTVHVFGEIPEWFDYEIGQSGWDSVISTDYKPCESDANLTGSWNYWALEMGVCPSQPFLVEIKPPRYYKCSYEYDEWDVEYFWDLAMTAPRSPRQAARAWELWKTECGKNHVAYRAWREHEEYKRTHDVKAMYIRYDAWGGGYSYDDQGYIVALCSTHGGGWLIEGRSPNYAEHSKSRDEGKPPSYERAWSDLLENIQKHLPHLDPKVIRELPRR